MKLISPKTALTSLLGCAFVAMKLIYFRDLSDLPIIIVVGYVSVRGLYVAFSPAAYEEEEREYGDQAVFKVTKEDGLVRLYTRVE